MQAWKLGVALVNKGTGRLVVDLQLDGDLMYDAGALWSSRGTDISRAHIGMDLFGPAPDFAGLARSMGWWAEGPIENADHLQPAPRQAIAQVKKGKPALVDAVTRHR